MQARPWVPSVLLAWGISLCVLATAGRSQAEDWPQLQHDAARTGRTADTCLPPYRARWVWFGPDHVLRNRDSGADKATWKDDLASRTGHNYPMPARVPFSFAGSMQPIVIGRSVYVADMQGTAYALSLEDGRLLWRAEVGSGVLWPGAAAEGCVVFATVAGTVHALEAETGKPRWQADVGRSVTSAPAIVGRTAYVATHGGVVWALDLADGKARWQCEVEGPVQGGLCVQAGRLYVGSDRMKAYAVRLEDGTIVAETALPGQSFRMTWPVAAGTKVLFTAVSRVCPGSEYVNDPLLAGQPGKPMGWRPGIKSGYPNWQAEEAAMRTWLAGEGADWETCFALDPQTLKKDYILATGATEGCGASPNPPALDDRGRPLLWYATAYPMLTRKGTFGSNFSNDVSAADLGTGLRVPFDLRPLSGQQTETDNLYGLTVGGKTLYLRQSFRGTYSINLETHEGHRISAAYRERDGGGWPAAINYAQGHLKDDALIPVHVPACPAAPAGRVGPAISGGRLVFTEHFCVTCVEGAAP